MRALSRRRGYTLVELMIVVAILGVMTAVGGLLFVQFQNYYLAVTARSETQRDARAALDVIDRFLRQAQSSTIVVDTPSGQGYDSRISFTTIDGRSMQFYQSGNELIAKIGSSQSVLTRDLYYLGFCFPDTLDPTIINVSLTTSKNIQLGQKRALQMSIQKVRIMN